MPEREREREREIKGQPVAVDHHASSCIIAFSTIMVMIETECRQRIDTVAGGGGAGLRDCKRGKDAELGETDKKE